MYNSMRLFRTFLLISSSLLAFGSMFKIMHWPGAGIILGIALVSVLGFVLIALRDIYCSDDPVIEKLLWLLGFVTLPWIAGFVYYFVSVKPKLEA